MIQERYAHDRSWGSEGAVPVDRGTIALASVRAARGELCRAAGLLHDAIRVAAGQGVSEEKLARAAGTSVDRVQSIAGVASDHPAGDAFAQAQLDGRGDPA